jgi:hypothetical protein
MATPNDISSGEPKEPELLYHYTTQEGLLGIIENRCLRATHSQFLNDLSEYRIIFDALQQRIRTERNDSWAVLQSRLLLVRQMKGIFVSSFSHEMQADSLTMWRGYSSPTGGHSIGFDRLVLNDIAKTLFTSRERSRVELGRCFYCQRRLKIPHFAGRKVLHLARDEVYSCSRLA